MNLYRRKLLNAILYFSRNTRYPYKLKMSKLLYFLDITHFKQVGYPSIGLTYHAFKNGPLPLRFWGEIAEGSVPTDFRDHLQLIRAEFNPAAVKFLAKKNPDLSVFTPRERRILEEIAAKYRDKTGYQMIKISHREKPWKSTFHRKGENAAIDYMLALDVNSREAKDEVAESLKSFYEVLSNFKISPELY